MECKKRSKCSGWECCYANKKIWDVWSRNESVRAEIGQFLRTHTHARTHARTHTHTHTHMPVETYKWGDGQNTYKWGDVFSACV